MTDTDVMAVGTIVATALLASVLVGSSRLPQRVKLIVYVALGLRFVGAFARQAIAADAGVYYRWGRTYAEYFSRLDFSPLFEPALWRGGDWLGANFVGYPTGLVIALLGPSWMGTFFAFGLLSFLGVLAYAVAYRRSFPAAPYRAYWAWVFLVPSLWFWPSSIGKEALMIVGLGVATLGFAGRRGRASWLLLAAGLGLAYCIRPQVVAVFLVALVLAYWLDFRRWTPGKMMQGVAILAVGLLGIWYSLRTEIGAEVDLAAVEGYIEENASRNQYGGSSIEGVGASPGGIPLAVVNVLFRPFVWEAHNAAALVSALEVLLIWGLVWFRRRELKAALKAWRRHRMLRFAVPFVALYVVALGMNLANLGLLARQRVLVFPLLFLIVEAGVYFRQRERAARAHPPPPRPLPLVPA